MYIWSYLAKFPLEWEMFRRRVVEKMKTHILCSISFSRKSWGLWDNVEKYCRAGQATADNTAHAHCMLDTKGYEHTLTICNTYCFSSATMFAGTRVIVTFTHSLPCIKHCCVFFFMNIVWRCMNLWMVAWFMDCLNSAEGGNRFRNVWCVLF